jgi:hypothetical protein
MFRYTDQLQDKEHSITELSPSGTTLINPDLKLCKSIPSFKIKLKRELLQQFLDS